MERVAREMVARLPRLAPGRYRVVRPPAGQLGEQAYLPFVRGELVYSPANLAPVAEELGVSVYQVTLAWHLAQADVVIPIPGASRASSIRDSAAAPVMPFPIGTLSMFTRWSYRMLNRCRSALAS